MDIRGYINQARTLPLDVTLRKAVGLTRRTGRAWAQLTNDAFNGSYGDWEGYLNPAGRIAIAPSDIPADLIMTLRLLGDEYLQGRFNLLGSGWVSPVYGHAAPGFLGHQYSPRGPAVASSDGNGLEAILNRANVRRAVEIWRLIGSPDYVPIDWQLDFRSGYRWSAQRPSLRLPIPVDVGADVKVPWELGRLQHLPQLALCAILAKASTANFAPTERYVVRIADQLADFIATNPPRFGVNWMCTMDVAIRAANIALTLALLAGGGLSLSPAVCTVVARSLHDHAVHIVDHLEYSETGRSNHYLADLGGLLWAGWILTGSDADEFLVFALGELLSEANLQFLPDGGNYEGSINYHCLSGEIVIFALALIASLEADVVERLGRLTPPGRASRVAFPKLPLRLYGDARSGAGFIPPALLHKLQGAARLTRAAHGADNTIVQIGDTDSGRFFNVHPTLSKGGHALAENRLDHLGFAAAVDAFSGTANGADRLDAVLVRSLAGPGMATKPPAATLTDFGDIDALMARWRAVPDKSRRVRHIPFGGTTPAWTRAAFPDFGLYVFCHQNMLIAFRCAGVPPDGAPRGHRHDDNLGLEYRLGTIERRDPGSFLYTPSIARRNAYRMASAHDVPRIHGQSLANMGTNLFDFHQLAHASCVYWREDGVAGEVRHDSKTILRIVHLSVDALGIYDCVSSGELTESSENVPVSRGYGRL
jgi:hypothetical protein